MNSGSTAMACSGWALSSNTACAAAQHTSRVSVSSMAAARKWSGMLDDWMRVSNGFLIFMFGPFVKLAGVGAANVAKRAASHLQLFYPRRHHSRLARREVSLLDQVARGQVRGCIGLAGAVGVFVFSGHAKNFAPEPTFNQRQFA